MGNSTSRKDRIDEQYTRTQGLYSHPNLDSQKLKKFIIARRLAPCYPGKDVSDDVESSLAQNILHRRTQSNIECPIHPKLEECPICTLSYPSLNRSTCCKASICTECFLHLTPPVSESTVRCPFCNFKVYSVSYLGPKSAEERLLEEEEEQKVMEAQLRIRGQSIDHTNNSNNNSSSSHGHSLSLSLERWDNSAQENSPNTAAAIATSADPQTSGTSHPTLVRSSSQSTIHSRGLKRFWQSPWRVAGTGGVQVNDLVSRWNRGWGRVQNLPDDLRLFSDQGSDDDPWATFQAMAGPSRVVFRGLHGGNEEGQPPPVIRADELEQGEGGRRGQMWWRSMLASEEDDASIDNELLFMAMWESLQEASARVAARLESGPEMQSSSPGPSNFESQPAPLPELSSEDVAVGENSGNIDSSTAATAGNDAATDSSSSFDDELMYALALSMTEDP